MAESTPKLSYGEQQKQNRETAYAIANKAAHEALSDTNAFRRYLDVQSHFNFCSVTNALLIKAQMPDATELKEFNDWKELGEQIKSGSKGIWFLKPGNPYMGKDGNYRTPYTACKVFDISQTNMKSPSVQPVDTHTALTALLKNTPVPIVPVNDPIGGARYMTDVKEIHVQKGMDEPDLFRTISMELALAQLDKSGQLSGRTEDDTFRAYSVSYMLCKRYAVDVTNYDFSRMPENMKTLDSKALRQELSVLRDTMNTVDKRMYRNLNPEKKKDTGAR